MIPGGKPDTPSLNEILASIRRIAEDETTDLAPIRVDPALVPPPLAVHRSQPDEFDDFELPAMFRRAPEMPAKSGFVARLSSALGTNNERVADPVLGLPPQNSEIPPSEVPREMPSCLDRNLVRMAETAAPARRSVVAARAPGSVPKAKLGVNYLTGAGSFVAADVDEDTVNAGEPLSDRHAPMPVLRMGHDAMDAMPADRTDYLRPLLRQWLDDNISRVFAQALTESVKDQRS